MKIATCSVPDNNSLPACHYFINKYRGNVCVCVCVCVCVYTKIQDYQILSSLFAHNIIV